MTARAYHASARTSCNTNGTSTFTRGSGIRCSSQGSIRENWNAVSGTRPESIRLDTDSTAIIGNFERSWIGQSSTSGYYIVVDTTTCEPLEPADTQSCRTREQGGQGREGRKRRDARENDGSHEFRGSVGTTPAISESRFGWRGN